MIVDKDFSDSVEIEYSRSYTCSSSGCDDICRCSTIERSRVVKIFLDKINKEIYNEYFDNSKESERDNKINSILFDIDKKINKYTIDRIIRYYKLWDSHNWNINIENGYYGEEISSVTINDSIAKKIENSFDAVFYDNNLSERIRYLLNLEYGYLLPELLAKNYKVEVIKRSDIIFPNDSHLKRVKKEKLEYYSDLNYNLIRGIVYKKNDKYKIIDGYHRCFATKNKNIMVLVAY